MSCTPRPIPEIEADLAELRAAFTKLLTGKSVRSLTIGSDDLQRRYSYTEINAKMLNQEIARIEAELCDAQGKPTMSFDASRRHNLVVVRNV